MNFKLWAEVANQLDARIQAAGLVVDGVIAAKYCIALADLSSHSIDGATRSDIERLKLFWAGKSRNVDAVGDLQQKYLCIKKNTENPDGTGSRDHLLALLICGATTVLGDLSAATVDVLCEAAEELDLNKEAVVRSLDNLVTA